MTINVKDVNDEVPIIEILSSFVPEELPPLAVVGRLFKVTDRDFNDTITYSLTGKQTAPTVP